MATCAQVGTIKPNPYFHGHTSHISPISPIPKSPSVTLSDPNLRDAMYKACLVANERSQQVGVDCDDTFSPVVKPTAILMTTSSTDLLQRIISSLHKEFDMTDLGALNYFLRISVTRDSTGMFLSQKKYVLELLKRAHMANCNPTRTPVDTESKLGSNEDLISNPTLYRSLACGLQYLTFTHPNIFYAVQQVCLHMHDPR
ncbi:ribonuclease H-like domain-containing protein [Tanacetum coccineum]|uniref:Ribonuclease H-like domain-containing protein n=1 Tax=Tanacetum coccineum TaxID=301880 RepID=A0ABQ5E872_9ASTR